MVEDLMRELDIKVTSSAKSISPAVSEVGANKNASEYIRNEYHEEVLHDLRDSLQIHDICLMGPRGNGKSKLAKQLALRMGLDIEHVVLYQVKSFYDWDL